MQTLLTMSSTQIHHDEAFLLRIMLFFTLFLAAVDSLKSSLIYVRPARTEKDLERVIIHKYHSLARPRPCESQVHELKRYIANNRIMCFMAQRIDDGKLAGYLELLPNDHSTFTLQNLVVDPEMRRLGVATALIAATTGFLEGKTVNQELAPWPEGFLNNSYGAWFHYNKGTPRNIQLRLEVHQDNHAAMNLYLKEGFSFEPRNFFTAWVPFGSGENKVMKKMLKCGQESVQRNPAIIPGEDSQAPQPSMISMLGRDIFAAKKCTVPN